MACTPCMAGLWRSPTGMKLANHELTVLVTGGDGDGFGSAATTSSTQWRRNVDLLYIVMDNQIYGLTTGQDLTDQPQSA